MMEWVTRDMPNVDPFVDDVIVGTSANTEEELFDKHYQDVRRLLLTFSEQRLVCHPRKYHFFMREVEFCGHILSEGKRRPAPGKIMPIQLWELPAVVTELRGFLGLSNHYSEYIPHNAHAAAPMQDLLQLDRTTGKKGSQFRLTWTDAQKAAFEEL
jgi:hypothetical protein